MQDSAVLYVEPNYQWKISPIREMRNSPSPDKSTTPNDSKFNKQWGLLNNGNNYGRWPLNAGMAGIDVNALNAWKLTKGSGQF
jgi:hypothetical protein